MTSLFYTNILLVDLSQDLLAEYQPFLIKFGILLTITVSLDFILFYGLRTIFRKLQVDIPLVILNVSQLPLLILIIDLSLNFSLEKLNSITAINWLERGLNAATILIITYWVSQIFTQVVAYAIRSYAKKTEAVWDDVLVPILERLIPSLTYLIGAVLFLETLGLDLTGIWVAFGGLTFVLGFALRDILSNFFSGLVLLIDTPFQFGDVISLPNGTIAVIKNIGLRVSQLYMIDEDCDLYMPNASLGNINIINLTRPTPHFAASIDLNVSGDMDYKTVTRIIKNVIFGHPDIFGDIDEKLQHLEEFKALRETEEGEISKKESGHLRLTCEQEVNQQLLKIEKKLEDLIKSIQQLEKGGLKPHEVDSIKESYKNILSQFGVQLDDDNRIKWFNSKLEEIPEEEDNRTLISLIRKWYQAWQKDPDLQPEDRQILVEEWETKINILKFKLNKLFQTIANPGGAETRLDDYAKRFINWLREDFKESHVLWKEPKVRLNNTSGKAMNLTIKFYVDHIKLERWDRGYRVSSEVRREIDRRLTEANLSI
ncbi:MAG: mechanosensitive ion channel [Cyanobacteriota bacterium]|nr:mechanosensitive ion channel [Cyanobacteriota bacterium]